MALQCNSFAKVSTGDTCQSIAVQKGIPTSSIFLWNSGVGDSCQTLWTGYYICVGVVGSKPEASPATSTEASPAPGPTQAGIISTCRKYLMVSHGSKHVWILLTIQSLGQPRRLMPSVCRACWNYHSPVGMYKSNNCQPADCDS